MYKASLRLRKYFKSDIALSLIPTFLWISLIVTSTQKSMFWGGDSIEFLSMMNQIRNGFLPQSELWLPFYPICVGFLSKVVNVDLVSAARVFAVFLSGVFVFSYNYLFVIKKANSWVDFGLFNIPVFSFSFLLGAFTTIMAELLFFVLSMGFLYLLIRFHSELKIRFLIWSIVIAVISVVTKLNGLANIVFLSVFLIYRLRLKSFKWLFIICISTILTYGSWLSIKPGADFLTSSISTNDFDLLYSLNLHSYDLSVGILSYFLPYRPKEFLINWLSADYSFLHTAFYIIFAVLFVPYMIFKKIIKEQITTRYILLIYGFLFIFLTFSRQIFSNIFELNARTLFYAFFTFSLAACLHVQFFKRLKLLFLLFGFIGFLSVLNTVKSKYLMGDNYLYSGSQFNSHGLIGKFLEIKNQQTGDNVIVFSNEHKILTLHNSFVGVWALPKSKLFMGNFYKNDLEHFEKDLKYVQEKIQSNNFIIVFFFLDQKHPRFDDEQKKFVIKLARNGAYNIFQNNQGLIIWS